MRDNHQLLLYSESSNLMGESYAVPSNLSFIGHAACKKLLRRTAVYFAAMHGKTAIIGAVLDMLDEYTQVGCPACVALTPQRVYESRRASPLGAVQSEEETRAECDRLHDLYVNLYLNTPACSVPTVRDLYPTSHPARQQRKSSTRSSRRCTLPACMAAWRPCATWWASDPGLSVLCA